MAGKTSIEWTEQSWNAIVGCSIVSPGCTNCYAMKMAARIEAMGNQPRYAGTTRKVKGNAIWTGKIAQAPRETLLAPLRRKKPTTYFVNSMSDLFHEGVPSDWIDQIFAVMALSPQHTFQCLTKRADRMKAEVTRIGTSINFLERHARSFGRTLQWSVPSDLPSRLAGQTVGLIGWPLPNVWLGVSTERQQEADERIPFLLETPAAVRFISAEPLLGPIDFIGTLARWQDDPETARAWREGRSVIRLGAQLINWVITGGESGPGARPANPQWYRDIRDQCAAAGIAFFHKQNGAWVSVSEVEGTGEHHRFADGRTVRHVGKAKAGRLLDGVEHNGMPRSAA